jgi:hypothetical protein
VLSLCDVLDLAIFFPLDLRCLSVLLPRTVFLQPSWFRSSGSRSFSPFSFSARRSDPTVPRGSYRLGSRCLFCLPSLDSVVVTCSDFSCSWSSCKNLACALSSKRARSRLGLHRSPCKCSPWAAGSQLVKPQVALQFLGSCSILLSKFFKVSSLPNFVFFLSAHACCRSMVFWSNFVFPVVFPASMRTSLAMPKVFFIIFLPVLIFRFPVLVLPSALKEFPSCSFLRSIRPDILCSAPFSTREFSDCRASVDFPPVSGTA